MNTITIARSAAAKRNLLQGRTVPAPKRAAAPSTPKAPSTVRLVAYMLGSGIAAGAILYVAFVIGVSRVTPEPIHNAAPTHHTTRGTA